jgi:hypothetical protein
MALLSEPSSSEEPPIWNTGFLMMGTMGLLLLRLWSCSLDEQEPPSAKRAGFFGCTTLAAGDDLGSGIASDD